MKKDNFIYLRGLKALPYSVMCVDGNGQKQYFHPVFRKYVPYSSGQQVKRSILESLTGFLGKQLSGITFCFKAETKDGSTKLAEGEVFSTCNPLNVDQLIGGWMMTKGESKKPKDKKNTEKGMKGKNDEEDDSEESFKTLKRRSPLSISAMTPLHPLLASVVSEDITFDRSDKPHLHNVIVKDDKGRILEENAVKELLTGNDRSLYRKWIPGCKRASGLFVYDVAIDLRRLFCVCIEPYEPEVSDKVKRELMSKNWKEVQTVFGASLLMPKKEREEIIPAIADALVEWRITSNQARTFNLMESLAIAVSDNNSKLGYAIRASLSEEDESKAVPIIEAIDGVNMFVTPACGGYIHTEKEDVNALEKAKQDLIDRMMAFDYENQI